MSEFEKRLSTLDESILASPVRRLLNDAGASIINWRYQPVEGGLGGSHGVYRFQGKAKTRGQTQPWSLILKALSPQSGSQVPENWGYWKREVLAYQSGLLDNLAGDLVAPQCFGIDEYDNEEYWLWLEDIVEAGPTVWPLERFGLAARHLGQFNGAYLDERPIPDLSWLSRDRLRKQVVYAEPGIAQLPQLVYHPVFEGLLPGDSLDRSFKIWDARERLLMMLDQLPPVLCHQDAFRRNLMARISPEGQAQTVALDWAELAIGVIGQEIEILFTGSLKFVAVDIDKISLLDSLIFAGYIDGLRDAGWAGDAQLVRFGFTATAALSSLADRAIKWPNVAKRVAALPEGAEWPKLLNAGGPVQAIAKDLYFIDLGEEALSLLDTIGGLLVDS